MAFTDAELATIRKRIVKEFKANSRAIDFPKSEINAAIAAIETRLEASRTILGGDIEAAAPGVFSASEKALIFAWASFNYAIKEGAN